MAYGFNDDKSKNDLSDVVRDSDIADVVRDADITDVVRDADIANVVRNTNILVAKAEAENSVTIPSNDFRTVKCPVPEGRKPIGILGFSANQQGLISVISWSGDYFNVYIKNNTSASQTISSFMIYVQYAYIES